MKYFKFENCQAGDKVTASFNIKSHVRLMTEENFLRFQKKESYNNILQDGVTTVSMNIPFDGHWYMVVVPFPSPVPLQLNVSFSHEKVKGENWNNVNGSSVIVHNSPNTGDIDRFDKADYWEEQTKNTIPQTGFIYRCCHESVDRDRIDGAHVKLSHVTNSKMYIVPLCQTCNRGRQDIDFIVPAKWLVELPEKQ